MTLDDVPSGARFRSTNVRWRAPRCKDTGAREYVKLQQGLVASPDGGFPIHCCHPVTAVELGTGQLVYIPVNSEVELV